LTIQATYPNDAQEKTAENVRTGGAETTEEAGMSGEVGSIAEAMKRDESGRSAEDGTESAEAARTAATS
jgi:hypothetical protein